MENVFIQVDLVTIKELSPQIYNGIQIYLAIKGDIQIDVNKTCYTLNSNDVLVINSHDIYSIRGDENNIALVLRIPFEYMRRECEDMISSPLKCYSGGSSNSKFNEIRRLMIYIMMIYSHMEDGYRLNVRSCLFQLLHYLLINFRSEQPEVKMTVTGKKDNHIASVIDYINENYKQSITLEEMANREFMSVYYLSRQFKNQTGMGFLEYISKKRLESAVKDLIYTDESILKIALQNGFANTKSFSDAFKKDYEDTPNQFRKRYQKKNTVSTTRQYTSRSIDEINGLGELLKYLKLCDDKNEKTPETEEVDRSITLSSERITLEYSKKIIKIGRWVEALKRDVQEELALAQKEIGFDYVRFSGIFEDGIFQYEVNSSYSYYDYIETLRFFEEIGLFPFMQLDLSAALRQFKTIEAASEELERFLHLMSRHFSYEKLEQWKFELVCGSGTGDGFLAEGYQMFYRIIKGISKHIGVGFSLMDMILADDMVEKELRFVLEDCCEGNCIPDFLTFAADPNTKVDSIGIRADACTQLRGYHVKVADMINTVLLEKGIKGVELYLMNWNTICGQSYLEGASFYRAALVSEAVLELSGHVAGLAIWISEKISEQMGDKGNCVLTLFHCKNAKRAAYFVLDACKRLGTEFLYRDPNIVVAKKRYGEYVIFVSNPCYFNPLYSMDYNFTRMQKKHFNVLIKNMEPGTYNFNVFRYVMNFSFAINDNNSIHELGEKELFRFDNADLVNYMANISRPEFMTYEKEIPGNFTFDLSLSFNSASLYIINKV